MHKRTYSVIQRAISSETKNQSANWYMTCAPILSRPHITRFLSCDASDRLRYETTYNHRAGVKKS